MVTASASLLAACGRRLAWLGFAAVFYQSGLAFTIWLLEPIRVSGAEWVWVALFPGLLPAFFLVNRVLGCGSGHCGTGTCTQPGGACGARTWKMPGV